MMDAAEELYNTTGKLPPIKDIAKKMTDEGTPTSITEVSQRFSTLRAEYKRDGRTAQMLLDAPWLAERPRGFAAGGLGVPGDNRTRNAGRYSLANPVEFGQAAGTLNRNMYDMKFSMPTVLQDSLEFLGGVGTNLREVASRVLSEIKTMNFSARSNEGYQEGYQILNDTANLISQLRTKYNAMLEDLLHEADRQTVLQVSDMLQFTSITKLPKATDKMLKELGSLLTVVNGEVIVDVEAFARMKAMGRYTLEEFRQGIEVEYEDVVVLDDGTIAKKKFKKAIAAIPDITENSKMWQLYQKTRDAMDEAAIDRVKADYFAATGERKNVFRRLGAVLEASGYRGAVEKAVAAGKEGSEASFALAPPAAAGSADALRSFLLGDVTSATLPGLDTGLSSERESVRSACAQLLLVFWTLSPHAGFAAVCQHEDGCLA
jgi:hypothetical protein